MNTESKPVFWEEIKQLAWEKQKLKRSKTLNTSKLWKIMDDAGTRTWRYKQNIKSLKLEISHFLTIWRKIFWRSQYKLRQEISFKTDFDIYDVCWNCLNGSRGLLFNPRMVPKIMPEIIRRKLKTISRVHISQQVLLSSLCIFLDYMDQLCIWFKNLALSTQHFLWV